MLNLSQFSTTTKHNHHFLYYEKWLSQCCWQVVRNKNCCVGGGLSRTKRNHLFLLMYDKKWLSQHCRRFVPNKNASPPPSQAQAQPPLPDLWQEMAIEALLVVVVCKEDWQLVNNLWRNINHEHPHRRNDSKSIMNSKGSNNNELWPKCALKCTCEHYEYMIFKLKCGPASILASIKSLKYYTWICRFSVWKKKLSDFQDSTDVTMTKFECHLIASIAVLSEDSTRTTISGHGPRESRIGYCTWYCCTRARLCLQLHATIFSP